MNITTGIVDIHHDDGAFDLKLAARSGLVALIHKASQGKDWHDPGFAAAMAARSAAGLVIVFSTDILAPESSAYRRVGPTPPPGHMRSSRG